MENILAAVGFNLATSIASFARLGVLSTTTFILAGIVELFEIYVVSSNKFISSFIFNGSYRKNCI